MGVLTAYRLWPSTNGPATASAYPLGNPFISGMVFYVSAEAWFEGYWWWVCPAGGQSVSPVKCALWQIDASQGVSSHHLVPGSVITSGNLTAGQWNYIPLATPIPLSLGGSQGATPQSAITGSTDGGTAQYVAAVGCNGPFPDTNNYWGAGQTAPNGITNGPLSAYSDSGGGLPYPYPIDQSPRAQGKFSTGGTDPALICPAATSGTDNFWVDVQVADYSGAPAGTSLRLWPGLPFPTQTAVGDNTKSMSGTAFTLTQACNLNKIWMFNAPGSTGLPSRCGIWAVSSKTIVTGADSGNAPAWKNTSGAAASPGDGWIYVDFTAAAVTLPPGTYQTAFGDTVGVIHYRDSFNYFFTGTDPVGGAAVGGPGWNGISWGAGILTAPNVAHGPALIYDDASGTKPGQCAYQPGPSAWAYPSEFEASSDWGETRWADVEVIPATVTAGTYQIIPQLVAMGVI